LNIRIFYDEIKYRIRGVKNVKNLIEKVIMGENKIPGDLNFIFTNDKKLRELNMKFLKHDYFTDVIAFSYSDNNIINGEIYISIDTVRINGINYKVSLNKEIIRVMIHGTLHLCGMDDKTKSERILMRKREDRWLEEFKEK